MSVSVDPEAGTPAVTTPTSAAAYEDVNMLPVTFKNLSYTVQVSGGIGVSLSLYAVQGCASSPGISAHLPQNAPHISPSSSCPQKPKKDLLLLNDISGVIEGGKMTALMGPSGSGKVSGSSFDRLWCLRTYSHIYSGSPN